MCLTSSVSSRSELLEIEDSNRGCNEKTDAGNWSRSSLPLQPEPSRGYLIRATSAPHFTRARVSQAQQEKEQAMKAAMERAAAEYAAEVEKLKLAPQPEPPQGGEGTSKKSKKKKAKQKKAQADAAAAAAAAESQKVSTDAAMSHCYGQTAQAAAAQEFEPLARH